MKINARKLLLFRWRTVPAIRFILPRSGEPGISLLSGPRFLHLVFIFACIFIISSCGKSLKPESYISWVENPKNGLCKIRTFNAIEYKLQYKTPEYIMLKNNTHTDVPAGDHSGIHYFGLSLDPADKKSQLLYMNVVNEQDYFARLQYYSFNFKNDISLNINGKKYACEYYFFESTGKITPGLTFTLGFDTQDAKGDMQVVVNDHVFGTGGINFLFKEKTLNNIPTLKNKS
jgi:hypothetical protein